MYTKNPISRHLEIFEQAQKHSGFEIALTDAYNAFSHFSAIQDYEGMRSIFEIIGNLLPFDRRLNCIKGLMWTSLHGARPDPVGHKRFVSEWHAAEVAPWLANHCYAPVIRRSETRTRVGVVGLDIMRANSSSLETVVLFLLSLNRDPIDLTVYLPAGIQAGKFFEDRGISFRTVARFDQFTDTVFNDDLDVLLSVNGIYPNLPVKSEPDDEYWKFLAARPARFMGTVLHSYSTWGPDIFDFAVLDPLLASATHDELVFERVERVSFSLLFSPPSLPIPVSTLPALRKGYITFGCFNRPSKYDHAFVALWRRILESIPTARLVVSNAFVDYPGDRERFHTIMAEVGLPLDRVDLLPGTQDSVDFLTRYSDVDVSLDPLWFNGGLTSFESLWCGVPVITCPQDYVLGRLTQAFLQLIDLTDWVVPNVEAYIDKAIAAAQDLPALAALRARLREAVATSRFVDPDTYGQDLCDLLVRLSNGPERPR